ncbi:hypothetical protein ACFQO9_09375 [Chryseobacterium zhengzhouense]|uniref:Uncharacterized protein n=1 Tax=Chryseobacterium zhengzhouense TaxID=1636086 RepID=A0ABW2M081_9FLAO
MKKAYYYLFYKLYKWYEEGPSVWMSDWKAGLSIDLLVFLTIFSFVPYFIVFFNIYINFDDIIILRLLVAIYIFLIVIPNYFIFHHKNQWKKIVNEFDKLPKKKNQQGGWTVLGIVLFIIINYIFSFYIYYQS